MAYRWVWVWVLVAGVCLGAAASLPTTHWARAWLALPAALPLLAAVAALVIAALALWAAVLRRGWSRRPSGA